MPRPTRIRARAALAEKQVAGEYPSDLPAGKCGRAGYVSRRTHRLCRGDAVAGTDACTGHAGVSRERHAAEGQIRLEFSQWTLDGHDGSAIDPKVEVLRMIAFWKWKANLYGSMLEKAYNAAERLGMRRKTGGPNSEDIVTLNAPEWDYDGDDNRLEEHPALQTARKDLEEILRVGGKAALIGHQYDVDRAGRVYAVNEGIRALVTLEERAHEKLLKCLGMANSMKVTDARVKLAEQVGVMIQAVILGVMRDLAISIDDRVLEIIAANIDTVAAMPELGAGS